MMMNDDAHVPVLYSTCFIRTAVWCDAAVYGLFIAQKARRTSSMRFQKENCPFFLIGFKMSNQPFCKGISKETILGEFNPQHHPKCATTNQPTYGFSDSAVITNTANQPKGF